MEFKLRDFSKLIGKTPLSEKLLQNHFKLYEGYVANTNSLLDLMKKLVSEGNSSSPLFAELKRRFAWEWNGVRLHELYFENIGGDGDHTMAPRVLDVLKASFGSYEAWREDFVATAKMRGIGWAVVYFDQVNNMAYNSWINEHNENHLSGAKPLLVIDVFEHAFMLDFGTDRPSYIEKILDNIDWQVIESRF